MKCCICTGQIEKKFTPDRKMYWDRGHNASPIKDGRCCDNCNSIVIIARLLRLQRQEVKKNGM